MCCEYILLLLHDIDEKMIVTQYSQHYMCCEYIVLLLHFHQYHNHEYINYIFLNIKQSSNT